MNIQEDSEKYITKSIDLIRQSPLSNCLFKLAGTNVKYLLFIKDLKVVVGCIVAYQVLSYCYIRGLAKDNPAATLNTCGSCG